MAEPNAESAQPIAEISHGPSAFEGFLDRNQKKLIAVGILASLGLGAYVVMTGVEEGANRAAGEALLGAEDVAAMEDVVKNHAEAPAAPSAAILLSDLQWEQGQQSAAIETLEQEIAAHPEHPASFPAQARLGARLIDQGSLDKAAEVLQGLADNPKASYLAPYALIGLAEIAVKNGDDEQAGTFLDEASSSYPESPFGRSVSDSKRYLGFQMPVEIDPPAPEPVEEPAAPGMVDPGPAPDLSQPIELDPSQPSNGGTSGNPLLDNLNQTPPAPAEDTPAPAEEAPAPAEETPAPAEEPAETPVEEPSAETPPADGE